MAESRHPRGEKEPWSTTVPSGNIQCRDCIFRLRPITINGESFDRSAYGNCEIYEYPNAKPNEVLWQGDNCPNYSKE